MLCIYIYIYTYRHRGFDLSRVVVLKGGSSPRRGEAHPCITSDQDSRLSKLLLFGCKQLLKSLFK